MPAEDDASSEIKVAARLSEHEQARPSDLIDFLDRAPEVAPMEGDALNKAS
ncbi:hypothetical protein [Caulobacter endophyticus]|uniref:hypothetical protein n=1 Tax=Caulobacter endophyticus TaxID=2172652 RepID=UPI00240EE09E|nr:hypothetical protein [Caulobacter endophyticus]MDG2528441.1 hypothetical protein [Caulobacter endophyticus]